MKKIRFALVVAVSMLFSSNLASQTTQKSTNGVTASECLWAGSFEVTRKWSGWTETMVGTVKFELLGFEMYNLIGYNLTWSASGTLVGSECKFQGGPLSYNDSSGLVKGYLQIFSNGTYYGPFDITDDLSSSVNYTCPDYSYKLPSHTHNMQIGGPYHDFHVENDQIKGQYTSPVSPIGIDLKEFWKWDLHKEGASEPKLIVEAAGYDNWMPEAARREVEPGKYVGNVLKFKARLEEADGTTTCAKADSFIFQLTKVSHEPGVCLNFPRDEAAQEDYDLHFHEDLNSPTDVMSPERLTLRTKEGREATATVASFDWGGFGILKVTAYMQGGKTITGYLEGHPEITDILIPKRSSDSKIADKWKQDHNVEGFADDDDTEDKPIGDGDVGDGFTLYEEYRGFSVKGEHIMGDPKKKDLFIYTESNDFFPGIQLFKALTGLNVHYELIGIREFDKEIRLMNFNHSDPTLHKVDQHGLWIKKDDSRGFSYTFLGPPKNSGPVNIHSGAYGFRTITRGSRREITNELNSTVAHELGHAVRIDHHGEADKTLTYRTETLFNLDLETFVIKYSEAGHAGFVIPKWENERLFTERLVGEKYIAVWGGEHCGVEDCIMRYDVAFAYIPKTGGDIRYIVRDGERTGIMLCDKKEDSPRGVNYLGRQPRSRYGSAVIGDCIHQICVNDKYH